jgi:lipid-A-disaccharide synthase
MAGWSKKQGFKTIYYIAPQVWAWKESRVKKIKKYIDQLFVILPFEESYFQEHNIKAKYFGHPLKTRIKKFQDSYVPDITIPSDCIACFPGSRKQEISAHMDVIIQVAKRFSKENFVIAGVQTVDTKVYDQLVPNNFQIVFNQNYQILSQAKLAIVSSGTATLEAALFNVPQVVIYRGNELSYQIAKRIIKLEHISLVNLLAKRTVVKELIQSELSKDRLEKEIESLLQESTMTFQRQAYAQINNILGEDDPSLAIASLIVKE